jgi:catechol 2,3-dioxygenase-like lactoylglutathione lyase family enzyme
MSQPQADMIERIDHVNIVAQDLPALITFYRDVVGLTVIREIAIRGDWIESITGLNDVVADVVYLEADQGAGLELIHYRNPEGSRPPDLEVPNTMGIRHIAFQVSDLDAVVASLQAAGAEVLSEIRDVPTTQVDFAGAKKRIAYVRDPENNLLEICAYE